MIRRKIFVVTIWKNKDLETCGFKHSDHKKTFLWHCNYAAYFTVPVNLLFTCSQNFSYLNNYSVSIYYIYFWVSIRTTKKYSNESPHTSKCYTFSITQQRWKVVKQACMLKAKELKSNWKCPMRKPKHILPFSYLYKWKLR